MIIESDIMVTARDGVLLATDVYRPATGSVAAAAKHLGLSTHGTLSLAAGATCNPGTILQADSRAPAK